MSDRNLEIPFQPIRNTLYSPSELLGAFDPDDPDSLAQTLDFRCYRYFMATGGAASTDPHAGMMEALHDNSIMRAMAIFLDRLERPTVAIMGGYRERRDSDNYRQVVEIARKLTQNGCLVASGGGPGAMEATHLGALLAHATDTELDQAIDRLKTQPVLPESIDIVSEQGDVDMQIVRAVHAWLVPAFEIRRRFMQDGAESLAVPTWYHGHEPVTPFAHHIAKYFQNSIREHVLLSVAANGIIYTPGAAGTLQEVFQDAAQNYYPKPGESFAPMIFFGKEFWTQKLAVMPLLEALFVGNGKLSAAEFASLVVVVDSVDEAVDTLLQSSPSEVKTTKRMKALGFGPLMASATAPR